MKGLTIFLVSVVAGFTLVVCSIVYAAHREVQTQLTMYQEVYTANMQCRADVKDSPEYYCGKLPQFDNFIPWNSK
jgi:hypothetical protein